MRRRFERAQRVRGELRGFRQARSQAQQVGQLEPRAMERVGAHGRLPFEPADALSHSRLALVEAPLLALQQALGQQHLSERLGMVFGIALAQIVRRLQHALRFLVRAEADIGIPRRFVERGAHFRAIIDRLGHRGDGRPPSSRSRAEMLPAPLAAGIGVLEQPGGERRDATRDFRFLVGAVPLALGFVGEARHRDTEHDRRDEQRAERADHEPMPLRELSEAIPARTADERGPARSRCTGAGRRPARRASRSDAAGLSPAP